MNKLFIALLSLVIFSTAVVALENPDKQQGDHQQFIPYSLDQTIQTFNKTVHGGVQHVVVKSPENIQQIKLIQSHLFKLASDFRKGNFSLPEKIHGSHAPGLAQLKAAKDNEIQYRYESLANGAQIHYSSEYPQYVQAIHEWFEAHSGSDDSASGAVSEHAKHHLGNSE